MNSAQRVRKAIALEPVDRVPVGTWGHTYREEWSPAALASATAEKARNLGLDFVKFQPRASCFAEAFGAEYKPSGHPFKGPVLLRAPVGGTADWARLRPLEGTPSLRDQVDSIGRTVDELGTEIPVIQTLFSPLTIAGYLLGKEPALAVRELRSHGDAVRPALEMIAETVVTFAADSVAAGAAGVFYAVSAGYAGAERMPEDVYRELVLPLDLRILEALPEAAWFNAVHLCGSRLHFDLAREFPVPVVSWSVHNRGNPSLAEGRERTGKAVVGGVSQRGSLVKGPEAAVRAEVQAAISSTDGIGLLLAPGCSVPPRAPLDNQRAMVEAAA